MAIDPIEPKLEQTFELGIRRLDDWMEKSIINGLAQIMSQYERQRGQPPCVGSGA